MMATDVLSHPEAVYAADFETQAASFAGPALAASLRREALRAFLYAGFPDRHNEEFRFTPLTSITSHPFHLPESSRPVSVAEIEKLTFGMKGHLAVLVDGRFSAEHSRVQRVDGLRIVDLAEALEADEIVVRTNLAQYAGIEDRPFAALNTAFIAGGAFISIARDAVIEEPIHILTISTAAEDVVSHPRALVLAAESSQATILESYAGLSDARYFTNAVTEIVCADNASLDHVKVSREAQEARHIATTQVQLGRDARFVSHNVTLSGLFTRNDFNAVLAGENGSCTLNGLYLASGDRLVDNHTFIDHSMPNCESHELYKGILDGRARGVFNGKILVRPDAQKTDAKQTNKTLLLSGQAIIDTKPQLEIYADDVKCTHGATVGQPDEEAIFYLRSRGIGEADARSLMTYAFASDIIGRIKIEAVREELDRALFSESVLQARGSTIGPLGD